MTHTSQSQRKDTFYLPQPLPPGQDRLKRARGGGNRSNLTMHYWMEAKSRIICTF